MDSGKPEVINLDSTRERKDLPHWRQEANAAGSKD